MLMQPFVMNRRTFVGSSARVGAALVAGAWALTPLAALAADEDTGSSIHAWLRVSDEGRTTVLLARSDASPQRYVELGPAIELSDATVCSSPRPMSWERLQTAIAAARRTIHETVARAWGVSPSACTLHLDTIVHEASARCLAYTIWVDPV